MSSSFEVPVDFGLVQLIDQWYVTLFVADGHS